jgi:hypothetical protein
VTPRQSLRDDAGAVLVMVALMLPVLILFVSFVADIGNGFEHRRHLQLQADAAALAAAGTYTTLCADSAITDMAGAYSGGTYNAQIGATPSTRVHMLLNSATFWNQSSPVDPDFAGGANSSACASQMIDVKMTENDLPWFFPIASLVRLLGAPSSLASAIPFINARARVQFQQLTQQKGALPLAVPDPNVKSAAAIFINNSGGVLAAKPLASRGTQTLNGQSLVRWDNVGDPASVTVPSSASVVFALSGKTTPIDVSSNNLTTICSQVLVVCYGGPTSAPTGLLFIHGYPATGGTPTNANPIVRDVQLVSTGVSGGCSDGSAPYFVFNKNCNVKVKVKIDFPTTTAINTIQIASSGLGCNGGNPSGCAMDPPTGSGPDGAYWTSKSTKLGSVASGDTGPLAVGLNFKIGTGVSAITGSIPDVQRVYAASSDPDLSGQINFALLAEDNAGLLTPYADSLSTTGNPHNLVAEIGIVQSLRNAQTVGDPITVLRVVGSQNQSIDCDPAVPNLRDEITNGCAPQYTINNNQVCPSTAPSLWASPQPWYCVAVQTGSSVGQAVQGFDARILQGGTCAQHTNDWASFPDLQPSDTRITSLFLTPFGTFSGSGNDVVPVQNFAYFYITGWGHNGGGLACTGDDKMPNGSNIPAGYVVGHFIKYVQTLNTGGSGTVCDPNGFGSCVAVLTK